MATPFACTIRSLEIENSKNYMTLIGAFITLSLAIMWGYWFFTAPILSYEVSDDISVTQEEDTLTRFPQQSGGAVRPQTFQRRTILAKFPSTVTKNFQPGQLAFLRLHGAGGQRGRIPVVVIEIVDSPETGKNLVKVHTMIEQSNSYPFQGDERGEISIETHRRVPAHVILHASGFLTDTPPIISPALDPRDF